MSCTVSSAALPAPSPRSLPPRSLTTTLAPCRAISIAWPRPMPWPAPVTIATLPSSSPTAPPVISSACVLTGRQAPDCIFRSVTPTFPETPLPEAALPETVPGVVHRAAALWPDDAAIVDRPSTPEEVRLTFRQLEAAVHEAAKAFVASGLQPGDRASVWAPNLHQWMIAALGLYAAGGVLVPLNTRFKGTEAAHVLRTSGARFLFTVTDFLDTNYVELLDDAGARALVEEIVILEGSVPEGTVSWDGFLARGTAVDDGPTLDEQVEAREATLTGDT